MSRCHYTQMDPYYPVTGLKARVEKEVLMLIAGQAVVVENRVASGIYDNDINNNRIDISNNNNNNNSTRSCAKLLASDQVGSDVLQQQFAERYTC